MVRNKTFTINYNAQKSRLQPKICMLKFRKKAVELSFKSFAKQSEILQQCKTIVLQNVYENFAEISVEVKLRSFSPIYPQKSLISWEFVCFTFVRYCGLIGVEITS